MFIDISGFSAMTQKLMKNGKEGADGTHHGGGSAQAHCSGQRVESIVNHL